MRPDFGKCPQMPSIRLGQFLGDSDLVGRVVPAVLDQHALARTQFDCGPVDMLEPCMAMPIGKEEEQALHLYTSTADKQLMEPLRRKIAQAFHQHVDLIEALTPRQLIEKFENRPFGRRYRQWPVPLAP